MHGIIMSFLVTKTAASQNLAGFPYVVAVSEYDKC